MRATWFSGPTPGPAPSASPSPAPHTIPALRNVPDPRFVPHGSRSDAGAVPTRVVPGVGGGMDGGVGGDSVVPGYLGAAHSPHGAGPSSSSLSWPPRPTAAVVIHGDRFDAPGDGHVSTAPHDPAHRDPTFHDRAAGGPAVPGPCVTVFEPAEGHTHPEARCYRPRV